MIRSILSTALLPTILLSGCGTAEETARSEPIGQERADESRTEEKPPAAPLAEDRVQASLARVLVEQERSGSFPVNAKQATCIAGLMLDGIGVDRLTDYGFLNEDGTANVQEVTPKLSHEDAEVVAGSMFECTDAMRRLRQVVIESTGAQSFAMRECLADVLTEKLAREVMTDAVEGKQRRMRQRLMGPFSTCADRG